MRNLYLLIISLVMYFFAPSDFSLSFCVFSFILFLLFFICNIASSKVLGIWTFNTFFSLSFLGVTYIFPLFIFSLDSEYSLFSIGYNEHVMSKATSLATMAYAFYSLGYQYSVKSKLSVSNSFKGGIYINTAIINKLIYLTSFLLVIVVFSGGLNYYKQGYSEGLGARTANVFFTYLNMLFAPLTEITCCCLFFSSNKKVILKLLFLIALIVILLLSTGSRTLPLYLCLIIFCWFVKYYKLSFGQSFSCALLGVLIFSLIGFVRGDSVSVSSMVSYSNDSGIGVWDYFRDLTINNRNLYIGYEHIKEISDLKPQLLVGHICSVVPFLQSIVTNIFSLSYFETDSASYLTYLSFGHNAPLGVGTHIVSDVYMALGFLGLAVVFYCLGRFIRKVCCYYLNGNTIWIVIYYICIAHSVFICRGSIFEIIKPILWSIIILYALNRLARYKFFFRM